MIGVNKKIDPPGGILASLESRKNGYGRQHLVNVLDIDHGVPAVRLLQKDLNLPVQLIAKSG
jgi:hypothetical protein